MRVLIYILLILFSITFVFICFMWFLSHASGHKIPYGVDRDAYCLMILNVLIISALIVILKKISKKE